MKEVTVGTKFSRNFTRVTDDEDHIIRDATHADMVLLLEAKLFKASCGCYRVPKLYPARLGTWVSKRIAKQSVKSWQWQG